jgi:phosphohistidine phosphatase
MRMGPEPITLAASDAPVDRNDQPRHAARVKIYLIRHAAAVDPGRGVTDTHRYLTAEGRQTCRQVGRLLREAGVVFDAMVTSPLVRAVQTAEILADAVDYLGMIESCVAFTPGAHPNVACKEILARGSAVAVVGHEPGISNLAAFLVGQPGFAPFRTAQVSYFERRQPMWKINPVLMQFEELHAVIS